MSVDTIANTTGATYTQQAYAGQIKLPQPQPETGQQDRTPPLQSGDQVQLKNFTAATKNLDTVRAIEQMHARLNELAKGARQTNEGLAQAAEVTARMKSQLQAIIKNFPPFSADSDQRQEILMSYVSLKKEIEQLMIPPPPKPLYESVKHMWNSLFSDNGQLLPSAIPKLETTSSEQQVKDAAAGLGKSGEHLSGLSNGITNALIKGQ